MTTIKSYTDLEQSKKLAEILPIESADMRYHTISHYDPTPCYEIVYTVEFGKAKDRDIPCWSLAALLNLLPSEFTQKGKYSTTTYKIDIRKYKFTDDVDLHQIAYGSIKIDVDGQYSFKDMIGTGEKEELLDAAFEMVCWLKENGKI